MKKGISKIFTSADRRTFITKVFILMLALLIVQHFGLVLSIIDKIIDIIFPFLVGCGMAYIWSLFQNPIEKIIFPRSKKKFLQKLRRPLSIIFSLLVLLGIVVLILYLVLPQIYNSIVVIAESAPLLAENLRTWFLDVTSGLNWAEGIRENVRNLSIDWEELAKTIGDALQNSAGGILGSALNIIENTVGFFVAAFTAIVFAIYLLFLKEKLIHQSKRVGKAYLPEKHWQRVRYVLSVLNETFSKFFKGQVLDAFVVGALLFIAMLIFRMPYALTISVVVMVTALIPMIGAFIGGAVGFLMIAVTDFRQAVIFLIILIVIQQLEGDLIYPKIVGDSVGLPGIWVFSAVIVGGAIAGPLGMIIAVPLLASIYKIFRKNVNKRLSEKELGEDVESVENPPYVNK
ncbi:MAG: AI-2E family transporter [Eubacteriales bacterium]|nr:AI-2E family transporter [Eubacteriales bacterium]